MSLPLIEKTILNLDQIFLWYFLAVNAVYTILLVLGSIRIFARHTEVKKEDLNAILHSNSLPEITFIVPMYNEGKNIQDTLSNLIHLTYRYKRIIAVNDGSKDETISSLKVSLDLTVIPPLYQSTIATAHIRAVYRSKLHPEVIVIDKEHAGKFDTVNAGINATESPFFIVIDADTFIDDKEFEAFIHPLLSTPEIVGIGASVRIRNGCTLSFNRVITEKFPKNLFPAFQSFEYLRSFLMRQGWDYLGGNIVIAGAFSIFPTELIKKLGGLFCSVAEDMEIVVRLHHFLKMTKTPYRISYFPDPIAWTQGPETFKSLGKQRTRWNLGLLECLWYHKAMLFNPKYGFFGLFNYPYWILGEALEPFLEAFGYIVIIGSYLFGVINGAMVGLLLLVSLGFTFIYSIYCLLLEELSFKKYVSMESLAKLIALCFIENFGYRQLMIYWRLKSFVQFFKTFKKIKKDTKTLKDIMKRAL